MARPPLGPAAAAPSFPAPRREVRPRVKPSLAAAFTLLSVSLPLQNNSSSRAVGGFDSNDSNAAATCSPWPGSAAGVHPPSASRRPALWGRRGRQEIPSRCLILGVPALQTRTKPQIRGRVQGRTPHSWGWSWGQGKGLPSTVQLVSGTMGPWTLAA